MTDEPKTSQTADAAVSVMRPGDGELIALGQTRMRVLEDGSTTGHRLGITESVIPPHTPGPPQHRHAEHDEGFYVLAGTIRFTVGTEAGTLVMVPPGAPHTFANLSDQPATMLTTFTPDRYVQYFRDLRDLHADDGTVSPQAHIAVMRRYATEPAIDFTER
ncbi:cupin domain-containing protein [Sciscionella marina]|uniref:cupin domain-containing protein n=1 Tax=Sciscionella marina TaxID=508770 RepID=UPI0003A44905|nr:cupin domain-containing protein [Sciscionella marina]